MQAEKFTLGFYFYSLTRILGQPRKFFSELPKNMGLKQPLGFLTVSSLFFAGPDLINTMPPKPVIWGGVFFVNAVGMTFISAGLGYIVMVMVMGKHVRFTQFFMVYALSSGVTLLVSWMPFFIWLTEPWKWWLIGTGMIHSLGMKCSHSLIIIGISVIMMVLFFYSVMPLILHKP